MTLEGVGPSLLTHPGGLSVSTAWVSLLMLPLFFQIIPLLPGRGLHTDLLSLPPQVTPQGCGRAVQGELGDGADPSAPGLLVTRRLKCARLRARRLQTAFPWSWAGFSQVPATCC